MARSLPFPALSDELLGSTCMLSMEQYGAYLMLLQASWRAGGPLADDRRAIIFLLRCDITRWLDVIMPALLPYFEHIDGCWRHPALERARLALPAAPAGAEVDLDLFGQPIGKPGSKPSTFDVDREFHEIFWPKYPKKADKPHALKAWRIARKKSSLEEIMAGLDLYKRLLALPGAPSVKYPQGWLSGERWKDEIDLDQPPPGMQMGRSGNLRPPEPTTNNPAFGTPEYEKKMREIGA